MLLGGTFVLLLVSGARAGGWSWPDGAGAASVRIDTKVRFVDDDARLVPLSPKFSSDDGIHEELRELFKNSRETYSDFSIFSNKPSICIQKVAFGEMELVRKTTDGHPKIQVFHGRRRPNKVQADEIKPPVETEGFYNRPAAGAGSGRYAVQSEPHAQRLTHEHEHARPQYSDGTLDSLQYCKCVSSSVASCHSRTNSEKACPSGTTLCCYKRTNRNPHTGDLGIFSELEDERPMLLPSHERRPSGPFSDPEEMSHDLIGAIKPTGSSYQNGGAYRGALFGPEGPTRIIGPLSRRENGILVGPSGPSGFIGPRPSNPGVLVGPEGPTGVVGPYHRDNKYLTGPNQHNPGVLVGPDGPNGVIGPNPSDNRIGHNQRNPGVLVGPDGPTGAIGPNGHENSVHAGPNGSSKRNPGVLVGPGGPTGVVGPGLRDDRDFNGPPSYIRPNQRHPGVLVGPEGPTGHIGVPDEHDPWFLIGPGGPTGGIVPDHKQGVHANHGAESAQVLVGPGGPTGLIGPGGRRGRWQTGPGLLVGPGGPTGIIGPGRRLLVGPGGPTGRLGPPRRPMAPRGYGCPKRRVKPPPHRNPKSVAN